MAGVLIAGLFGFWLWTTLNDPSAIWVLRGVRRIILRLRRGHKLLHCPWCFGLWSAGPAYVALSASEGALSALATPVGVVAAAAVVGLLGTFVPIGDEGE
jgi:hypothetical protein